MATSVRSRVRLKLGVGADRGTEGLRERVGREVGGMTLAEAQAAERGRDLVGPGPRGVEDRRAVDELDRRARSGDRRPAALGIESGPGDHAAADGEVDAHDVTAGAAARGRGMRPGGHVPAPARVAQMVFEALVRHSAGV